MRGEAYIYFDLSSRGLKEYSELLKAISLLRKNQAIIKAFNCKIQIPIPLAEFFL